MEMSRLMRFTLIYFSVNFVPILTNTVSNCVNVNGQNISCESPLVLTPYIRAGKIEEALNLSRVHLEGANDVESYSGYIKVDETCNSNMFFWFFPSQRKNTSDPVVLWLQGGPGMSGMYSVLYEIGPFYLGERDTLTKRKHHWSEKTNLLFVDNPVGTGFSFTDEDPKCYARNQDDVRKGLYETITQFFGLFLGLKKNDFFIFGESYAGKYIPAVAYSIHENNEKSEKKINLKGLGIGNGFMDPGMIRYSELLYNCGLINNHGKKELKTLEDETIRMMEKQNLTAVSTNVELISSTIKNITHGVSLHNYLENSDPLTNDTYFSRADVKHALHAIGENFTYFNPVVFSHLNGDFGISVKPLIEKLLENYRIMFYNGQLDVIIGASSAQNFLGALKWSGGEEFQKQSQFGVMMSRSSNSQVVAFGTKYGNLLEYRIRRAGHMVPKDQPEIIYHIMDAFVNNKTLRYIDLM